MVTEHYFKVQSVERKGKMWPGNVHKVTGMTACLRDCQAKTVQKYGEIHREWTEAGLGASRTSAYRCLHDMGEFHASSHS